MVIKIAYKIVFLPRICVICLLVSFSFAYQYGANMKIINNSPICRKKLKLIYIIINTHLIQVYLATPLDWRRGPADPASRGVFVRLDHRSVLWGVPLGFVIGIGPCLLRLPQSKIEALHLKMENEDLVRYECDLGLFKEF